MVNDVSGLPPESPGRPSTRAELEEVMLIRKINSLQKKKEELDFFYGNIFRQPKMYLVVYELVKIVRGKNLQ